MGGFNSYNKEHVNIKDYESRTVSIELSFRRLGWAELELGGFIMIIHTTKISKRVKPWGCVHVPRNKKKQVVVGRGVTPHPANHKHNKQVGVARWGNGGLCVACACNLLSDGHPELENSSP